MNDRNIVLKYIIDEYFQGSTKKASDASGYQPALIDDWLSNKRTPQKQKVQYLLQCVFTPEFRVIIEYGEFVSNENISGQLKVMLSGHEKKAGIYAFYDSMANLIYVGKATSLLAEINAAIRRDVHVAFPKGVDNKPENRYQIVKYISAYDVGNFRWIDFPKHVESLLLRISKPPFNKNIGHLNKAYSQPSTGLNDIDTKMQKARRQ